MVKVSKRTIELMDWFKERGFLFGRRHNRYYTVEGGTGETHEHDSVWQAQQYVTNLIAYRNETETPMQDR